MRTEEGLRLRDAPADPPPDKQMDLLPVTALIEGRRYRRYGQGVSPQKRTGKRTRENPRGVSCLSISAENKPGRVPPSLRGQIGKRAQPPLFDPSFSLQMQKERHSGGYRAARDGQ